MSWIWLDSLTRDLRYAARLLARTPAFAIPAVASLALGIAVNTALFSVINAALLRPLGGPGTGELVRIGRSVRDDGSFRSVSQEDLRYLREQASSFGAVAGQQIESIVLTGADRSELVSVETVTGNYFPVLGVSPAIGRAFTDEDDRAGAAPAIVISDRFWRRRFAWNRALPGTAVRLNDREFTVVGVAPPGFVGTFPGVDTDFWLPAAMMPLVLKQPDRREPTLMLLARLRPDVSIETARAELQVLARRLVERDGNRDRGHGFSIATARGIHPAFARIARPFLLLLMAVVGLVLVIACINVAGLMLARAHARHGELAVRLALGAGRSRLVAQLLVESALVATLGGLTGLLLADWPVRLLNTFDLTTGPTGRAIFFNLQLDGRVLVFTVIVAMLTTLVFGLLPALQATRVELTTPMKESGLGGGIRRSRLRGALMVVQVALSCVLLVGASLLTKGLYKAGQVELGFDPDGVVIATLDLRTLGADSQRTEAFYAELLRRARALPLVDRAAFADFVPMGDPGAGKFRLPEMAAPPGADHFEVPYGVVTDRYFSTVRQPVLRGRDFTANDRRGAPLVAIVNEALARRAFPGSDALGQRLRLAREQAHDYEIVGIVRDARFWALTGAIEPLILVPALQHYSPPMVLHVRSSHEPSQVTTALERLVSEIDRTVPFTASPMREGMEFTLVPGRVVRFVFSVAGVIALVLASVGLYALVWYSLEQRVKEIGVRVALGATRGRVFRVIVGSALRLTAIGVTIGVAAAAASTRLLSALLYGVSPTDPLTFGAIPALLLFVSLAAGYAAARRGLTVDPVVALRHE
jgi:predicted permease